MSEAPGPRALREFAESLVTQEGVASDVAIAVARLLEEGTLTSARLVSELRALRSLDDEHGKAESH